MSYDLYDFKESLNIAGIEPTRIEHCSLGFGDSPDGYGSWEGGFVCHTRSGKPWVFVFGWCDTTGWGCQDGAYVVEYDHEPSEDEIREAWGTHLYTTERLSEMLRLADSDPIDLNRFLRGEISG